MKNTFGGILDKSRHFAYTIRFLTVFKAKKSRKPL